MIWTQQLRIVISIQFDRLIPTFVIGFKFKTIIQMYVIKLIMKIFENEVWFILPCTFNILTLLSGPDYLYALSMSE